jgi:hypothetical protein
MKERIEIPKEVAASILVASSRTCCVCNEPDKEVQIHHIDEDPSNTDSANLAVLCFSCHNETQIRGGFGRKLDAVQVLKYKAEWVGRNSILRKYGFRSATDEHTFTLPF